MQWFRFYSDTLNHPKAQKLPGDLFKIWVNILCIAADNEGVLPEPEDLAFALRATLHDVLHVTKTLIEADLLTVTKNQYGETLSPKNWRERQYKSDSSTERVQRHREKQKTVTKTVTETPPEQSRADTEQKERIHTKRTREIGENDFRKVYDEGSAIFPALATRNTASITKWLEAGADPDLDILPELRHSTGRDIRSWSYFDGAIADAIAKRAKPMPTGKAVSQTQKGKNNGSKSDRAKASALAGLEG